MNTVIRKLLPRSKTYDRYFLAAGISGLVFVSVLIAVNASLFARSIVSSAQLEEPYRRFEAYQKGIVNYPSPAREEYLLSQAEVIDAVYARLQEQPIFFDSIIKADMQGVSPLKFKEALFLLKSELRAEARAKNVALPRDIGFAEAEHALPTTEKLPDLFNALETTRDIVVRAIQAGVEAIEQIAPFEMEKIQSGRGDTRATYYKRIIDIEIIGDYASIVRYVQSIYDSQYLLSINACSIIARDLNDPRASEVRTGALRSPGSAAEKQPTLLARIQIEQLLF
jgi:hypothetical protein